MNNEIIVSIISVGIILLFLIGIPIFGLISEKMEREHELKKLGILKPNSKKIKIETDYNAKLKYQLKFWLINIIAIVIICTICKLFGFGISDIVKLIK